jgi:hypothetical protein
LSERTEEGLRLDLLRLYSRPGQEARMHSCRDGNYYWDVRLPMMGPRELAVMNL